MAQSRVHPTSRPATGSQLAAPAVQGEPASAAMNLGTLRDVLLVRIACAGPAGMTRAGLRGDLAPLVAHRLEPSDWRRSLDELLFILLTEGLVVTHRMRLTITEAGMAAATGFLGAPIPARADWSDVRDVMLVGRALGVEIGHSARRKKLESANGLRGAILERSFGLPPKATATVPALRDTLARKVEPKAAKAGPAAREATAKMSVQTRTTRARRAVERLLKRPREFASDSALLAELAAEQVGAQQTSVPSLRRAILRKLIGRSTVTGVAEARKDASPPAKPPARQSAPVDATSRPPAPDAYAFHAAVVGAARSCAEGWPGNRRAYVAKVWQAFVTAHPSWHLPVEDFKAWLVEAHKAGSLTLAYADLRSKDTIDLVQASAVRDRNNEWHFIRVDD